MHFRLTLSQVSNKGMLVPIAGKIREQLCSTVTAVRRKGLATGFIALSLAAGTLQAQEGRDLSSLSVDDLMNVEVTSVSRKEQKLSDTAAAVFVITQDDIRQSGATSIPEVLRIVPGLEVARINGNTWAISARGSNGQFANKLLVMIDGRTVYTPLFAGVYWDVQDTLLEDIDRIEVIRGPGGTLWGANAVNGVINIITKHSIETQGRLVSAGGGAAEGSSASARYGGAFGNHGSYRIFGKTFDHPVSFGGTDPTHDAWSVGRGGFRADWTSRDGDNFTTQGDIYRGTESTMGAYNPSSPLADRAALNHVSGEDLLFRWTSVQSSRSDTTLQVFYDYGARSQPSFVDSRRTFDVDLQNHLKVGSWNDVVWGAGYRRSMDRVGGTAFSLVRDSNLENIASAFVQDEILVGKRLHLTLGTKLQYEPVSGLQLQPTLRLLSRISPSQTVWAAATSAVRTPSEMERYVRLNVGAFPDANGTTGLVVLTGTPTAHPERVNSFEVGYRWQAATSMTFDATAFHSRMSDLIGTKTGAPFVDSTHRTIIPIVLGNSVGGKADGAEFLFTDTLTSGWNVALGYTLLRTSSVAIDGLKSHTDIGNLSPRHQLQLRSSTRLSRLLDLDASAYYVGRLGSDVPSYLRLDTQLVWKPAPRWELTLSGQNLLRARHREFAGINGEADLATDVQRTVNGKVTWRF